MEVTKANSSIIIDEFERLVESCDFYAVDQEMTGISIPSEVDHCGMTLSEAYSPKRAAACRYSAFQFGIALYHRAASYTDAKPVFDVRPFNFYLRSNAGNDDVILNISAVQFLLTNHMDFQKWLASGMTFGTEKREEAERKKCFPVADEELLTAADIAWVDRTYSVIAEWFASEAVAFELTGQHLHPNVDVALHQKLAASGMLQTVVVAPPLDSGLSVHQRKVTRFNKVSTEAAQEAAAAEQQRRLAKLHENIGFRSFWNAIVRSKKPHVGHNYFSDLLFMMNQHHAPLPLSYMEFKETVHSLFPAVFDTKYVAQALPSGVVKFANTSLEPLFKEVQQRYGDRCQFQLPLGFERYHSKSIAATGALCHEGAYDAYMTGIVFATLRTVFSTEHLDCTSFNKVAVFGNHFAMNLGGTDALSYRTVYHIAIPRRLYRDDIKNALVTEEQAAQQAATAGVKRERGAPPAVELDFSLSTLNNAGHGKTQAIVAFFDTGKGLATIDDVRQRIAASHTRLLQSRAGADDETSNVSVGYDDFIVSEFSEWKYTLQTTIGGTETPREGA